MGFKKFSKFATAAILPFFAWFWLGFTLSCDHSSPAKKVAQKFLDSYYNQADLQSAKILTTGMATLKIQEQLDLGGGQVTADQMKQRKVSTQLLEASTEGRRQEYFYKLSIQVGNNEPFHRKVRLSLENSEATHDWKVVNFVDVAT